jgi:predicted HTH transcriptional regulator
MNIRKLILEGEGVTQDFKKKITSCEKIAKTMVSFANNKGGRLLVGISDDGTIQTSSVTRRFTDLSIISDPLHKKIEITDYTIWRCLL